MAYIPIILVSGHIHSITLHDNERVNCFIYREVLNAMGDGAPSTRMRIVLRVLVAATSIACQLVMHIVDRKGVDKGSVFAQRMIVQVIP